MKSPDRSHLTIVVSILVVFAVGLDIVFRIIEVSAGVYRHNLSRRFQPQTEVDVSIDGVAAPPDNPIILIHIH